MAESFYRANKIPHAEWLVGKVVMRPALRRAFGGVYASVHPSSLALGRDSRTPLIFCATHSGWWDGHMAFILDRQVFRRDVYLMMEQKHLARYRFFTFLGTFGVSRDDPRSALASINYISEILASAPNPR